MVDTEAGTTDVLSSRVALGCSMDGDHGHKSAEESGDLHIERGVVVNLNDVSLSEVLIV